jgi:hypothetical protein
MTDSSREQRLQIMLTDKELEALDTWRFNMRMPSRAAAIRELLSRGLKADGFAVADASRKSSDFGVGDQVDGHRNPKSGTGPTNGNGRRPRP